MKKLWAVLALATLCQHLHAATPVTTTSVSGHWTAAGSPYLIYNDVAVPVGSTLIIDPGVQVLFQGFYSFEVDGVIQANGTASQPIKFTSADTTGFSNQAVDSGGWKGLQLVRLASDASVFRYCDLSYIKNPIGGSSAPFLLTKDIVVSNCRFHDIFSAGHIADFYPVSTAMGMDSCTFTRTSAWFHMIDAFSTTDGRAVFTNNTIWDNTNDISFNGTGVRITFNKNTIHHNRSASGTVYISYAAVGTTNYYSNGEIIGNSIHHNSNYIVGGIKVQGGRFYIAQNLICNNSHTSGSCGLVDGGGGLSVLGCITCGSDDSSHFEISNNIIGNNYSSFRGGGIYVLGTNAMVFNNTIVNNYGKQGGGLLFARNYGKLILRNNIFYGNMSDTSILATNTVYAINYDTLDCSNNWFGKPVAQSILAVAGAYSSDTTTNITWGTPGLVMSTTTADTTDDATVANFGLQTTSLCIDKGDCANVLCGGADYSGNNRVVGTSVDIGAIEYGAGNFTGTTGVGEVTKNEIILTPNPADGMLTIRTPESAGSLTVYDLSGRPVYKTVTSGTTTTLFTSNLSNGLYLIQWQSPFENINARLVVNHQ